MDKAFSTINFDYLEMVMTFIRQRIHEIPRTDQNRHKRKALRSISTEVSEFLHCWLEDDEESNIFILILSQWKFIIYCGFSFLDKLTIIAFLVSGVATLSTWSACEFAMRQSPSQEFPTVSWIFLGKYLQI